MRKCVKKLVSVGLLSELRSQWSIRVSDKGFSMQCLGMLMGY
jgi:hypothetical protein